ncbi:MAG: WD40 repeat domain-containing protein, partial [Candidatus Micrarchaeota archaeon]
RIASVTGEIVKAWDIPTRNELMTLTGGSDQFMSVTFDHSGRMVASAGGPTVKVWDTRNIGGRRIMETGYDGLSLNSLFVCLSRDGKRMAFNNAGYAIRVCNIDTLTILCTIEEQGNYPRPPSISADGKRLASCSRDSMVTVWDIDTGSRVRSFTEHASPVRSAALNPDGRRLAFGTEKGLVRIFDVDTGQEVVSIESGGWVGSLAFGTDGKSVACAVGARAGARVKIWDGRSGRLLRSYPKHDSWCQHGRLLLSVEDENGCIVKDEYGRMIADVRSRDSLMGYASPDFRRFVAPYRNTYQVYDSASGDELMTVGRPGQGTPVLRALFTPDGKRVVSLDSGGTIVIWEALDWTKTPEELEQEKLERWRRMWKETYGEKKP